MALRLVALVLIAIGVVLFLPIPFMNSLPGIGILLIGVGLLNRDGVFVVTGTLLCIAMIVLLVFFGHLLVDLFHWAKGLIA